MDRGDTHGEPDLRPLIARLREIERKCASMGSRNEEFPLMQARVASIIEGLESGPDPGGGAPDFAAAARQLFPVAHLFESVGFLTVSREIAHIERALRELAPEAETPPAPPRAHAGSTSSAAALEGRADPVERAPRDHEMPARRAVPVPAVIALLILAAAVTVALTIVLGIGPAARLAGRTAPVAPSPTGTPAPSPTAPPEISPSPTAAAAATSTPLPLGRLNAQIAKARLAVAKGDIDAAVAHLSAAALIDRDDDDVVEIADGLVRTFLDRAREAASAGQWDEAAQELERAGRMAMRFGVDENRVKVLEREIATMERYRIVAPSETGALRAAIGLRVELRMRDGEVREGRIGSVEASSLVLDVVRDVGGGDLRYTEEVPLAEVAEVKIFEQ